MSGSSSRVPPLLAGHDPEPMSFPAGTFDRAVDVWSWASALPRLVLATRTSFARFLASAFHLRWGDVACPPTALYPLPVPKPGCFDVGSGPEGGLRSSSRKRRALLLDRAVHIVAMSLNFLHSNFRFVPEALLQRRPSPCQLQVLARLRDMLRASSRSVGQPGCAPLCFGRRGVHLVARLSLLDSRGLGASPYAGKPLPQRVGHFAGGPSALPPYRDSDFFLLSFLRLAIMSGPLSPAGSLESFVFAIPPPLSCFSTFCPEVAFVSSLASSLSVLALLSFASVSALTPALRLGVPCALAKLWVSLCLPSGLSTPVRLDFPFVSPSLFGLRAAALVQLFAVALAAPLTPPISILASTAGFVRIVADAIGPSLRCRSVQPAPPAAGLARASWLMTLFALSSGSLCVRGLG